MKIVFPDSSTMGDIPFDCIACLGDLVLYDRSTRQEALERVRDCEILIVNKVVVDDELLDAAPLVKCVCEAATGMNNIDLEACRRRGIPVSNVAGYSTEAVVQTTFMHLLSLMCSAPYYDGFVKSGEYSKWGLFTNVSYPIYEVYGKTIGIIGMGTIGKRVAQVAEAFGMKVVYYSTSGTSHCKDYPSLPLDELMRTSDAVTIHAPLNERTRNLIGGKELSLMKPTAVIINAGRGGIIDEAALCDAVDGGIIAGAALDVFSKEPLPADNPLMHVKHPEKFRFTPHTAWASVEARRRLSEGIADNIKAFLKDYKGL